LYQQELSDKIGIKQSYLSMMGSGKKPISDKIYLSYIESLQVLLELKNDNDLVEYIKEIQQEVITCKEGLKKNQKKEHKITIKKFSYVEFKKMFKAQNKNMT
jgi:DNA-binding Xre family transcriptional regulator